MLPLVADSNKAEPPCSRANGAAIHDLPGYNTVRREYVVVMLALYHAKGVIVLSEPVLRETISNSLIDADVELWSQRYYSRGVSCRSMLRPRRYISSMLVMPRLSWKFDVDEIQ
jgi:hypothetical protein